MGNLYAHGLIASFRKLRHYTNRLHIQHFNTGIQTVHIPNTNVDNRRFSNVLGDT